MTTERCQNRRKIRLTLAVAVFCVTSCAGCYDGNALVKQAQSAALKTRLAEVELGSFKTTLPRDPQTNLFTDIDMRMFGTVPRYRLAAVKKQLKSDEYKLRAETLTILRAASREDLAEPNFEQLRARLEKAFNAILAESPIKEVGFYQLTLRHR